MKCISSYVNLNLTEDAGVKVPDKFELVNCKHNCANCKIILFQINRLYHESEQYQFGKEYQYSVMSMKKAFEKTYELILPVEQKCANIFRLTIIESLEKIHQELKRMTNGFYCSGRFKRSLIMSEETLQEFKTILSSGEKSPILDSTVASKDKQINLPVV
jgi:hypothetical protein